MSGTEKLDAGSESRTMTTLLSPKGRFGEDQASAYADALTAALTERQAGHPELVGFAVKLATGADGSEVVAVSVTVTGKDRETTWDAGLSTIMGSSAKATGAPR